MTLEEDESPNHHERVEWLKSLFTKLNLPVLPPHIIYCEAYHPDAATRIEENIVVFEYINSNGQFNFDIGGLTLLLLHKDIIHACVAVVNDDVFPTLLEKVRKHRNPFLEKLIILHEQEVEEWLKKELEKSSLWSPEDLL